MRRPLALLAVPVLVLALAACGGTDAGEESTAGGAPAPSATATSEAPLRATGEPQDPTPGFPTVELADDGAPTVTVPETDPPADLQVEVLKKGDGAVVQDGDTVTVQYEGVVWQTGETFDSSWQRGEPATFGTGQVITGFAEGMVGQTVGSQTIVSIPPADGYGDNVPQGAAFTATDTLVFVIDILAVG
ncbi:hypothetical protein ASF17_06410 [Frigoribacterium sp. Leaf263]|uniref:FKBP-type peptidyl-prolyl cis-trans isomerase n=1 Tax=Frigoribacterium sp. Leaf263 TaxID=1736313 RepID=UPI0006F362CD|nr:FKBP-type peptidyl-prolyl cis-trans isomerase [Frigoribacterium sp. Leaf263]KQO82674.1 hypothetical protein ASF17_06410 [Frigoribacterium sp. Leaf263]